MSLSPGKYCLRYSRVLFEQRGGAPFCWNTTVFISMSLFLLIAWTHFLRIINMYRSALTVTRFESLSSEKYDPKILHLPIARHPVTFSLLNGCWVCLWGSWDAPNLMFCLLTCPLKWIGFITKQNQAKITWVVLDSFTDGLTKFTPLSLLVSVCFWTICTLYRNNFKSLWMILCAVVLEMPTSWDSRHVDFHGDCSRYFLTVWTLARVLTETYRPPWPLLPFPTLPVFQNFSTIFVIVFLHGVFLPGNSLRNSLWIRTTDFVEK